MDGDLEPAGSWVMIPLSALEPHPDNIRDNYGSDIDELVASMRNLGQIEPITVYPARPDVYYVWMGHRRLLAMQLAKIHAAKCVIEPPPVDDLERLDRMGAENIQRKQLNVVEEARYYLRYFHAGLTQLEIARRCSVAQSKVSQYLSLLELSDDMQRRVASGEMTIHKALLAVRKEREKAGRLRPDAGGTHKASGYQRIPHFDSTHPMHQRAIYQCRAAEHDISVKINGACGPCWERVIATGEAKPVVMPVKHFATVRDLLAKVLCTRCGTPALHAGTGVRCTTVRDGRRFMFEDHSYVMQVSSREDAHASPTTPKPRPASR